MSLNFWKNKKVFLTGHTGFKGSWLCLWLQSLGAQVTGFSLEAPTKPNLFELADVKNGMNSIFGDVRDMNKFSMAIQEAQPEIVFHLAAQAIVRQSYIDPIETYSTNIMGTIHLYEAIKLCASVKAVVNVTSDKCYENKEWVWGYRENEPMGGFDPYSSSKGCVELITSSYRNSFFNNKNGSKVGLASARAGNVIGGGDWAKDRLIPDILHAIGIGNEVIIRNPLSIRPWQHVLEPLSGYMLLAQKLFEEKNQYAEAWNFGPNENDAKSVQWIVESLISKWGGNCKWRKDLNEQPHEASYLKLDCSKVKQKLGWQPKWTLDEALLQIVAWQKAYMQNKNMRDTTLNQIDQYQKA